MLLYYLIFYYIKQQKKEYDGLFITAIHPVGVERDEYRSTENLLIRKKPMFEVDY